MSAVLKNTAREFEFLKALYRCILLLRIWPSKFECFVAAMYSTHEVGYKGVGHSTKSKWVVGGWQIYWWMDLLWDELYYEYAVIKVTELKVVTTLTENECGQCVW